MELRVFVEPQQGADYEQLRRVAVAAEAAGYGGFFRSDHFLTMGGDGLPGPSDAWLTLAALARDTSRLRLGTLVSSATFRHPGLLAVQVAQVDQMSGGRVELGLGAGWYDAEHSAYGVPFPALGERFDRLQEQLEILSGIWATPPGELFQYPGRHYQLTDCPALPRPQQQPVPLILGGLGPHRTPALAARFAAEFNAVFVGPDVAAGLFERVRAACAAIGRDPGGMIWSAALTVAVGRNDAEVARRADAIGRDVTELRTGQLAGTPGEVVHRLGQFAELGVSRCYLQVLDLADLAQLDLIAAEVAPQLA